MNWKKLGKAMLFPHIGVMLVLIPVSAVLLIYTMVVLGSASIAAILSYVLAAYTLTVWCIQIPHLIHLFRSFKSKNKLAQRWQEDTRFRVSVSLYGSLLWNTAYAVLQLGMGLWHHTFWFCSLSGYYLCLAGMRFFLARYTTKHKPGEKMRDELIRYRLCGVLFLLLNITLSAMVFFMVYWNRSFQHHRITAIAMAAYTFTALTVAIINIVKYRKHNSPVYSASKAISLASACVSMLTLEATMLTTFGDGTMMPLTRKILLGSTGGVISAIVILTAILMITQSTKKIKLLNTAEDK